MHFRFPLYLLKINKLVLFLLSFLFFIGCQIAKAEDPSRAKFNPGKMITEHISDSHDWHLWGEGENTVAIPLPVIIYVPGHGLTSFMSSAFHQGEKVYKGFALKDGKVISVNSEEGFASEAVEDKTATAALWDISITKNVVSLFISMLIMLYIFISVAKSYTSRKGQAPKGLQSLMEPLIIFVRDDIAKSSIGEKKYKKYANNSRG